MTRAVEACPFRSQVEPRDGMETARCGLIEEIVGADAPSVPARRDACEHCCRLPAPGADRINSVIASLLYGRATRFLAAGGIRARIHAKAAELRDRAIGELVAVSAPRGGPPGATPWLEVPPPRELIDSTATVDTFTAHLDRGEPFSYLRYNDGEWLSILGARGRNGDGHDFFADTLGRKLGESLEYAASLAPRNQRYYVGLHGIYYQDPIQRFLLARRLGRQVHWVGDNLFSYGLLDFSTKRFLEAVQRFPGPKYLVANPSLAPVARGLGCTHVIVPRIDCYLTIDRAEEAIRFRGAGIVVCCAGMASECLLARLHRGNPAGTYVDCGHIFDAMVGVFSRDYTKQQEVLALLDAHYVPAFVRDA